MFFSSYNISDTSSTSDFQFTNSHNGKILTLLAILTSPLKTGTPKAASTLFSVCQPKKSDNQASKEIKMKILEWMHHKFRHNSIKPFKDLNIGNTCIRLSTQTSLDDQDLYTKPNYGSRDGFTSTKQPKQEEEKYYSPFEANKEEETSAVINELFHGFLTIGTLGSDASINEPETPTFATPLENTTDGRIKVTENHLKLINYELEKFLEAESKEEGSDESSARNSNVSTITLGGKQMEKAEDDDYWKTKVCPLQGYLFGSSIELREARTEMKKEKASLGELFLRTKITAENSTEKHASEEIPDKHKHKSAMRFVKKMIKKVNPSSKSSSHSAYGDALGSVSTKKELGNATAPVSTKKNLQKVIRMFHRKIHPESSMAAREFARSQKCEYKNTPKEGGCAGGNLIHLDGDNISFPQGSMSMDGSQCRKKSANSPQKSSLGYNHLREKGEHWIKIDDDYLVLELQQQKL